MERMKIRWKVFLIALLILLPAMMFFPACGKEDNDGNNKPSGVPAGTTYTVHFYTGTEDTFNISNQTIAYGGLVRRPDNPTRTGHVFIGWYRNIECTEVWTFEIDTVTSDMTLYAKWQSREY
jgi:uncharacterized repeat protein (TIGR02543 family)